MTTTAASKQAVGAYGEAANTGAVYLFDGLGSSGPHLA